MKSEDVLLGAVLALLFVFVASLIRKQTQPHVKEIIVQEDPWFRPLYPVNYWERPGERVAVYQNAWLSPWGHGMYVGSGGGSPGGHGGGGHH